jgi:hypothetical protein
LCDAIDSILHRRVGASTNPGAVHFDWSGGGDHQTWVAAATASRLRSIQDTVSNVAGSMGVEVITSASALDAAQATGAQVYFQSAMIGAGYNSQTPGITTDRVVRDLFGSSTPGVGDVAAKQPLAGLPSGTYANAYTASYCQAGRSMGRERCYI